MAVNQQLVAAARGQNRIWRERLGKQWPTQGILDASWITSDVDSDSFIAEVAAYQEDEGLVVDGILGPKTAAHLREEEYVAPVGSDYVIVQGARIPIDGVKVVSFNEPDGLEYAAHHEGAWTRTRPASMFVLHAKGAEGNAQMTWSYLKSKALGVHFTIERDGTIWQFADPGTLATAHIGKLNNQSVGVEMCNQMWPSRPNPYGRPIREEMYIHRDSASSHFGEPRKRVVQGFLPAQLASGVRLVRAVCAALGIPEWVPTRLGEPWAGLMPGLKSCAGTAWKKTHGVMHPYTGVLCHLNATNGHQDPSLDIVEELIKEGFGKFEIDY